jgi:hypothetical protein
MLKKLMILLGCFSLLVLGACGDEDASASATDGELGVADENIVDESEDEVGNPAYEGEVEDVSLVTSPDNGSMIDPEEDD